MTSEVTNRLSSVLHGGLGGTFLSVPHVAADADALRAQGAKVAFYGMPWDATSLSRSGANYGPRGIRELSCQYSSYNATIDFDLEAALPMVDCGDCVVVPANAISTFANAERDIDEVLAAAAIPVIFGGDHSITIPAVRSLGRVYDNPSLVVLDSHLDTSFDVAGELLNHATEVARAIEAGFSPEQIVLVGHNGWINPREELEFCRQHGIRVIWLEDIWDRGADSVADQVIEMLGDTDGIYLSVDVDAIDASHMVGTSVPAAIGMTAREVVTLIRRIAARGLIAFDIVEVAPGLDPSCASALLAGRLVVDALASHAGAQWDSRVTIDPIRAQ
ncbi:agmatinase family protein [Rhodococcus koreensis]